MAQHELDRLTRQRAAEKRMVKMIVDGVCAGVADVISSPRELRSPITEPV
jgi:phage shock protein PspC (stress-responsive transcriptional regulator)